MKLTIILMIGSLHVWSELAKADNCKGLSAGERLMLLQMEDVSKIKPSIWAGYDLEKQNYLFLSVSVRNDCAIIVSGGRILGQLELKTRITLSNGIYDFYGKESGVIPVTTINPEIDEFLASMGLSRALAIYIDFDVQAFGQKPFQISAVGLWNTILEVGRHEGFTCLARSRMSVGLLGPLQMDETKSTCAAIDFPKTVSLYTRAKLLRLSRRLKWRV
jgi:hypothetical protein